ncbi:MAG: hypothetical protein RR415_12515 [Ruthenibacterium sp.]
MENSMFALAEQLKALRDEKVDTEAHLKEVNAAIDTAEQALVAQMIDSETQNFTRNGVMFCLTSTVRASAVAGHRDDLFDALRQQGYGTLVTETVNANSLSAFVKEQISENEDALPAWLDGLVNVFEKTTVGVRNSTRKI